MWCRKFVFSDINGFIVLINNWTTHLWLYFLHVPPIIFTSTNRRYCLVTCDYICRTLHVTECLHMTESEWSESSESCSIEAHNLKGTRQTSSHQKITCFRYFEKLIDKKMKFSDVDIQIWSIHIEQENLIIRSTHTQENVTFQSLLAHGNFEHPNIWKRTIIFPHSMEKTNPVIE